MELKKKKTGSPETKSTLKKYECGFCSEILYGLKHLAAHKKFHREERQKQRELPLVCEFPNCGKTFNNFQNFQRHIGIHDPDSVENSMYPCPLCTKKVKKKSLSDHVRRHNSEKKHKCDRCDKTFSRPDRLKIHKNTHLSSDEKCVLPCNLCDFKTSHMKYLRSHLQRKHSRTQQCTVCDKKFRNKPLLVKHSQKHIVNNAKVKVYKCEECDKSYTTSDGLRAHVNSVHKDIKYMCPYPDCGKSYVNTAGLNYHVGTHDSAASELHNLLPCPICKQKFKKGSLRKHFLRHSAKNKTHKCDSCHEAFFSNGALKRHKITHIPPDKVCCKFCKFQTAHKDYLKTHVKRMHSQISNPYVCSLCGKRFLFLHNLTEHLEIHKSKAPGAEIEASEFECRSGTDSDKKNEDTKKRTSGNGLRWWKSACKLGMLSKVSEYKPTCS